MLSLIRNNKGVAMGLLAVSIALAGIGIAFVGVAQSAASLSRFSTEWPTVEGKVLNARLDEERPVVGYEYEVEGESYKHTRIFLSEGPYESLKELADGIRITVKLPDEDEEVKSYTFREAQPVTVHYNPHEPRDAVLEPVLLKNMHFFLVLGIGAVVLSMFLGVRSFLYED